MRVRARISQPSARRFQWHHGDVVGARLPVLRHPRGDRVGVAPGHETIHQAVAQLVDVIIGEPHPAEVLWISGDGAQDADRPGGDLPRPGRIGLQHDHLRAPSLARRAG
ncbi:MAG: hypothetical protein ACRDN9_12505 [Streptosporangiaceae bacterium]